MLHRFIAPGGGPPQQTYMVSPPQPQTMYPMQPTYHPSGLVKYSAPGQTGYPPGPQYQYQAAQGQFQGPPYQGSPYSHLPGAPYHIQPPQTIQGVPQHMQGAPQTMQVPPPNMQGAPQTMQVPPPNMQGAPQTMQVPPTNMQGAPQTMQVSPQTMQGVPRGIKGSGTNVIHPTTGSGYGKPGTPSSIYTTSWASEGQSILSPPRNVQSQTSATQVSSSGLKQAPALMQDRSAVQNQGSFSHASNYQSKVINIDIKSTYSQVSDSGSAASSASSSPRKSSFVSLAQTVDETSYRDCSPPIAPHPFATRKAYVSEESPSEDVDKIFQSRASIHGIRISAPGNEKPSKETPKTKAPKRVYQQKVKADRFMEIALKRGITVSSGPSILSEETRSEATKLEDNSSANSVADIDELLPLSESDENCDIRSYFSDSCSQSDSESHLIEFSNQFAKTIIEKACAELANEAKKSMLDFCEDEESVSMDSEVQEYFDAPVVSHDFVQDCETKETIQSPGDVHSESPMNLLYVDTDQVSILNVGACEFVSQSQLTFNEAKGLSLNPESPEFKPSFFKQHPTVPSEDPIIALYKKNCSSGVDVYIADPADVEEFEDAEDDLQDIQPPDTHHFHKKVLMVDASVNTKRVRHKDVEQQTPLAFEPRDVCVNTDEVCMVEGSEFFTPEVLMRTTGTNTTPLETKCRGIQARVTVETRNSVVQVGSDDFKPSPQKDLLIVELQMQVCHLRAQMCISELQRQKNELKRSKFQINTFFSPGDDNEDNLTEMLNARIGWLEDEISQTKIKLMKSLEALQEGLPLEAIPAFGITIPTAAGNIVYKPKELRVLKDEDNPALVTKTRKDLAVEREPIFTENSNRISTRDLVKESLTDLQRERKLLNSLDAMILSDTEDMSVEATLNPQAVGSCQSMLTRTTSTDLNHSLTRSPQDAHVLTMTRTSSMDPLKKSLTDLQNLQKVTSESEMERKQVDTSDSVLVSAVRDETNVEPVSFGERLNYFERKSKSLDTSTENTTIQDGSRKSSKSVSPSGKQEVITEKTSLSVQNTVNRQTEVEQYSVEALSESLRVGKCDVNSAKSITDSSASLLPCSTPPGLSVSSTPSPLMPLALPLPSKPLSNLKQGEESDKETSKSVVLPEMSEQTSECVAPPGFKALEKIQETGNNLDLETNELVQKAQSLLKNFAMMKQTPGKPTKPASSPTKSSPSPTKPLSSPSKPLAVPPGLVSETSVEADKSEGDQTVETQTCHIDDKDTGISQLILSAKKKLRESKILEKQFERSLSNSPIDFDPTCDQSIKPTALNMVKDRITPDQWDETDNTETNSVDVSTPEVVASDAKPQLQSSAESQDIVTLVQRDQPQASQIQSKTDEAPQQQVAIPPQTLQNPQSYPYLQNPQTIAPSQQQVQPQSPTPQINPNLYQTVLAQVAKAYPHLTANPMMLHSVCVQQTMVLQAYMKNAQNPGTTGSAGQSQGPPQGLSGGLQKDPLGQVQTTHPLGQSQGPSQSAQGLNPSSTSLMVTATNTTPVPEQKPVLQPLKLSNENQAGQTAANVGAGDGRRSAFQSVKPNQISSAHDGKSWNPSASLMHIRKGTGDADHKANPSSTFTFQATAGPATLSGKTGDTENIPPTFVKNKTSKPEKDTSSETTASPTNPFDQTSGFTKVTYQKKRPTTKGKTCKTSPPNPEELFPKVTARKVPADEDWEGQCDNYPEEFTCKQDAKAPVYFTPIEPPPTTLDDFTIPKAPKASETDHKPRGRGRRRNNSSRNSSRSNTPSDDSSAASSRRNSYLGLDEFGSDLEAKPNKLDTNFLGRLLKHTVKSNNRLEKEKEERRANKTPDPEKQQEVVEEDWQTVSQKKRKRDQVRADQLPSMAVVPAPTSKTQKGSTRNNFDKLVDHLEKTFPFLSRQELKDLIQTIRFQRGGGLTGMKMNDIVDAARLIIQQKLKAKLVDNKKPALVPPPSQSVYCTPEFQKHFEVTKSYLPPKPVVRSPGEDSNDEDVCPICFENFSVNKKQRLDCGHEFHVECIREWVMKHERTCPTCRRLTLFQEEFPRLK